MKTLLIGLDGATFTVLNPLLADGKMPFLKQVIERGVKASLFSTPNPLTPPAWTSIATGRSPGNHGIYDFVRGNERDGSFYYTLYNASDNLCETIWSIASRNKLKTILMNYPMTAPPEPINGVVIPSMVQWRHMRKNVHPETTVDTIKEIPGFDSDDWALTYSEANEAMRVRAQNPKEEKEWVYRNTRRDFQWFNIFSWFMKNQESDLNAIVFDGVDKLQHLCWYLIDPAYLPEKLEEWEVRMREYILEYYQSVDSYLRDIAAIAGPNTNLFIVSDHGFGPTQYVFHVNVFLEQKGYLKWLDMSQREGRDTNHEWSYSSLDWQHTSAYGGTPSSNGVWLRAPGAPGQNSLSEQEYETLKERVIRDLLEFRDPVTGEQVVAKVTPREEAFPGAAVNSAPDLLLTLSDHSFVSVIQHESVVYHRPKVNGTHRPDGILIGHGPHIKKGETLRDLSLLDVAPTVLYSLGLPVPDNLEGEVVKDCFSAEFLDKHPVEYDKGADLKKAGAQSDSATPYDEEEEQAIFAQLHELGYME